VFSLLLEDNGSVISQITTTIIEIRQSRQTESLVINGVLHCTTSQRLFEKTLGWIPARQIQPTMQLMSGSGGFLTVETIEKRSEEIEVLSLTTDHSSHNVVAHGFLCHNMKRY